MVVQCHFYVIVFVKSFMLVKFRSIKIWVHKQFYRIISKKVSLWLNNQAFNYDVYNQIFELYSLKHKCTKYVCNLFYLKKFGQFLCCGRRSPVKVETQTRTRRFMERGSRGFQWERGWGKTRAGCGHVSVAKKRSKLAWISINIYFIWAILIGTIVKIGKFTDRHCSSNLGNC